MINIFIDMDGVLANYRKDMVKQMNKRYFFLNRPPLRPNIEFVKRLLQEDSYRVFILSKVLNDTNPYMTKEKVEWVQKYLPELSSNRIILVPYNGKKADYIKKVISETDLNVLIDDYTHNLKEWSETGSNYLPIKMINRISHAGRWGEQGNAILFWKDTIENKMDKLSRFIISHHLDL